MSAELRDRQLQRFCDVLEAVPAEAPTLCEGWTAYDVAIHLWILKHDPWGWPGVVVPRLDLGRSARVRRRFPYDALVARLRSEPGAIACMPLDFREDYRHALGEYWMHTQDVARPSSVTQPEPDAELQEALWLRVQVVARALHRRTAGLVLVHPDGRSAEVTRGPARVVVTGEPTELLCWAFGRTSVADVTVSHTP
jgi:uncharacterized protein (TIGR03085 family)